MIGLELTNGSRLSIYVRAALLERTLDEGASADGFTSDRKPATLIVGQPKSPTTELLLENTILLSEILDDCVLMTANPELLPW